MMKSKSKTFIFWCLFIGVFLALLASRGAKTEREIPTPVSDEFFRQALERKEIESWTLERGRIVFRKLDQPGRFLTATRYNADVMKRLAEADAYYDQPEYVVSQRQSSNPWTELAIYSLLLIGIIAALFWFIRKIGGAQGQNIFALRNSKARLAEETSKVKFDNVGGCVEAKQELSDLVDFLKSPQRWIDAGARLPRGVLLEGPPGCGKTLLAKAVAGETEAKFYYTSASEFVEMFVGVGPARVRDMFETAKKNVPAVLFIDELDAIGRRRGSGIGFANEEREQTLNQILVCMDGFEAFDRVVVIAATNRADILDKALVRAGRFDRRIPIPSLTREERVAVLQIHTRSKPLAEGLPLGEVAGWTDGNSGADLEGLANDAALFAVRRARGNDEPTKIQLDDFRQALESRRQHRKSIDAFDAVLFEATTQLAEPTGRAVVRATLQDKSTVEGEVVWVDPCFLKLRRMTDGQPTVIPKGQVIQIETLDGTTAIASDDVKVDRSLGRGPSFA